MADYVTKPNEIIYLDETLDLVFENEVNPLRRDLDEVFTNTKTHINSLRKDQNDKYICKDNKKISRELKPVQKQIKNKKCLKN